MSYSDYLAGVRDGIEIGFNAGYRAGIEANYNAGYLAGYDRGYKDASLGLPYQANNRLLEYNSFKPEPLSLPKIEPITYEPPTFPKIEPITYEPPTIPRIDFNTTRNDTTSCGEPCCPGHLGFGRCLPRGGPGLGLGLG